VLDRDSGEIGVEFLSEDHGDCCVDPLPHLGLWDDQYRFARFVDADESVRRELALKVVRSLVWLVHRRCAQRPLKRQKQAAAEAAFQYSPARKVGVR
jgi:hypothetical protein